MSIWPKNFEQLLKHISKLGGGGGGGGKLNSVGLDHSDSQPFKSFSDKNSSTFAKITRKWAHLGKLVKLDRPVLVDVHLLDHVPDLVARDLLTESLHHRADFWSRDVAILVRIELQQRKITSAVSPLTWSSTLQEETLNCKTTEFCKKLVTETRKPENIQWNLSIVDTLGT